MEDFQCINEFNGTEITKDTLICECNGVGADLFFEHGLFKSNAELLEFIAEKKIGTGCGQCLKNLNSWVEFFLTRR